MYTRPTKKWSWMTERTHREGIHKNQRERASKGRNGEKIEADNQKMAD